jgi:hypothetical protein
MEENIADTELSQETQMNSKTEQEQPVQDLKFRSQSKELFIFKLFKGDLKKIYCF